MVNRNFMSILFLLLADGTVIKCSLIDSPAIGDIDKAPPSSHQLAKEVNDSF